MRSMPINPPYTNRGTTVQSAVPAPSFGPYAPAPLVGPARYRRRRSGGPGAFLQGAVIGFVGGAVVMSLLAVGLFLIPPPPRANILFLGLDRRPDETSYATRSDTMILATVFPQGHYVGMLSIPRDLYVTQNDGSLDRINTAHFYGELALPGSGPAMAMHAVQSNFGVSVNRYVRVDLAGFVRIIDAMGGIDITVPDPLVDDEYPTYDYGTTTVVFDAGPQHMDGERALAYARIRHGSSDLQRAERQQVVIEAVFQRLLEPGAWPRLPLVAIAVQKSVDTDLSPLDVIRLAPTLLWVGPGNIDRRVIEGDMVEPYISDNGADVLLPVWDKINPVLREMFGQ
jgi:LCP family protein required for cell wall assembly